MRESSETCELLAFVALEGDQFGSTRNVLIRSAEGWHVVLIDVPGHRCPLVHRRHGIVLGTADGERYQGRVMTEVVTEKCGYVLLTGVDELRPVGTPTPNGKRVPGDRAAA